MQKAPKNVDAYIANTPKESRAMLRELRKIVRATAPKAEEKISYAMPYYGYHGRLLYFAGYKSYVGVYFMRSTINAHKKEVKPYQTSMATLQFPIGKPLPAALIKKLVKARVKENETRK